MVDAWVFKLMIYFQKVTYLPYIFKFFFKYSPYLAPCTVNQLQEFMVNVLVKRKKITNLSLYTLSFNHRSYLIIVSQNRYESRKTNWRRKTNNIGKNYIYALIKFCLPKRKCFIAFPTLFLVIKI